MFVQVFQSSAACSACSLVEACSRVILTTSATSFITCYTKAGPSSEMIVIGKNACLVMMLNMTLATPLET